LSRKSNYIFLLFYDKKMWQLKFALVFIAALTVTALVLSVYHMVRVLPVKNGGTGASTAAGARTHLEAIGTGDVIPVSQGGTASSTAAAARESLESVGITDVIPISRGGTGVSTIAGAKEVLGVTDMSGIRIYSGTVNMSLEGSERGYLNPLGESSGYLLIDPTEEFPTAHQILLHPLPGAGYLRNFFVRHASYSNGSESPTIAVRLEVGPGTTGLETNASFTHSHAGTIVDGSPILYNTGDDIWSVPADSFVVLYVDQNNNSGYLQFRFGYEFVPTDAA